jgi:hypothetical protein
MTPVETMAGNDECPAALSAGIAVNDRPVAEVANIMSTYAQSLQASQGRRFTSTLQADRHVSLEDIAAFISSNVSPKARNRVVTHLADCRECRRLATEVELSRAAVDDAD